MYKEHFIPYLRKRFLPKIMYRNTENNLNLFHRKISVNIKTVLNEFNSNTIFGPILTHISNVWG